MNDMQEEIETSAARLAELELEQTNLPQALGVAVANADAEEIIKLRRRADDLPIRIQSERIRVEQLRIQAEESKFPAMHAEIERLYPAIVETRRLKDEAGRAFSLACNAHQSVAEELRQRKIDVAERKRGVEAILNSKPNHH
jgi:DNA polymerase III sliding clamp (beta) subunit (PCNA family)